MTSSASCHPWLTSPIVVRVCRGRRETTSSERPHRTGQTSEAAIPSIGAAESLSRLRGKGLPKAKRRDATVGSALAADLARLQDEAPGNGTSCRPRTTADVSARCPSDRAAGLSARRRRRGRRGQRKAAGAQARHLPWRPASCGRKLHRTAACGRGRREPRHRTGSHGALAQGVQAGSIHQRSRPRYMPTRAVPRPATARTIQTAITQLITGKGRAGLSVSLAIMATMPVIPAPIPAPRNTAGPLPDREDSAGEREPDEPVPSLASTRLSISAPIRSTKCPPSC
jgi:hypothetical protein